MCMANIKGANKDAKIHVGRSTTLHNLLFCAHTLCMNCVTNTFILASSSVSSKQPLCFVHGQGQEREQKHTTKNFVEFHNHFPLLTIDFCNAIFGPEAKMGRGGGGGGSPTLFWREHVWKNTLTLKTIRLC